MAVKIRLMRIGAKKRPFYRVVAVDESRKRTGGYLELLGTYNPLTEPKEIIIKKERLEWWIKQGATPSDGYLRMIGEAPQKPPRKPKKEKKAVPAEKPEEKKEEAKEETEEEVETVEEPAKNEETTTEAKTVEPTETETKEEKTEEPA